ncbi:XRE family transcriptional regulator [Dactylosporangium salmoneum]|uniref:MmyB-like transcription regulator ligand binding domain-containing protein n=1 Tax=Dactylosporangium salmoneum TaxID=53361 RepID=A0ABN3FMI1_9ACTN
MHLDPAHVGLPDIAPLLDRSVAATRQLASRGRRRAREAPVPDPDLARQRRAMAAFLAAARDGDLAALVALLDPDVRLDADTPEGRRTLRGAAAVGREAMLFLAGDARRTQLDWTRIARETVGNLRANLARHPADPRLRELIDELRRDSPEFATWWHDQTVHERSHGRKRLWHPAAGELTVCYDALGTRDGSDQYLFTVTPATEPDAEKLRTILAAHTGTLRSVS